ncbi:thiamine pyrophosphokinase [Ruegeria marisrubri]|uniref:Thiamine diphosphokinase n=1 Tax=Ruegeria marisrubri TaxID=1685379 RepID=A0A101CYK6_9RHOB|nr:thiamine diphosphokinase [Ruegeria marisrubri]KUJ85629.1 thiamine pyrophosphokinase [Ruegeria marisrubri]
MCLKPENVTNVSKNNVIVRSEKPITLVGGGEIGPDDLNMTLNSANLLVAADGGAHAVLASGRMPDVVIGDFDSLQPGEMHQIPQERLFPIREQDTTDFDKALRNVAAPLVFGVGFTGARVDHQLAVFSSMIRWRDRPCLILGEREVIFHAPPWIRLPVEPGSVVSLFPMRRVTGRSEGLEWPIDGLVLEPDGMIGTSNRALGEMVLEVDGPGLLVMVPREALGLVTQAFLTGQAGRWPARAE